MYKVVDNMNEYKKTLLLLIIGSLSLILVACGGNSNEGKKEVKAITVSDILNGKEERQIIMTEETDNTESPQVKWAGTIGNGEMEIHPYANKSDLEFDDLKNVEGEEYKETLRIEDSDYEEYGDNKKLNIHPRKSDLLIGIDGNDEIKGLLFDTKLLGNEKDKALIEGNTYIDTDAPKQQGWLSIESPELRDINDELITPYVLYIKKKDETEVLRLENKKEDENKYKNVRFVDID